MCFCTTHTQVEHPPLLIRKEKLILADMGRGSPTHTSLSNLRGPLTKSVKRRGVNKAQQIFKITTQYVWSLPLLEQFRYFFYFPIPNESVIGNPEYSCIAIPSY